MTALPQRLLDIVSNAVHVHSQAGLPEHRCQGEQKLGSVINSAKACGFSEVFLTEHTTNPDPGNPHRFEAEDELGSAILERLDVVKTVAEECEFNLYGGLEGNILEDGTLDVPEGLASEAALVIASMHGHVPGSGTEVADRLIRVMGSRDVDLLGHPQRYVNVYDVQWDDVFGIAADPSRPTAVEANFNARFTYGATKLLRKAAEAERKFEHERAEKLLQEAADAERAELHFLQALGRSAAPVVVSLDIHNAGMWPTDTPEADWMPTFGHLEEYLDLLFGSGITPERIINRNLRDWLLLPKSDRGKLMTWL